MMAIDSVLFFSNPGHKEQAHQNQKRRQSARIWNTDKEPVLWIRKFNNQYTDRDPDPGPAL